MSCSDWSIRSVLCFTIYRSFYISKSHPIWFLKLQLRKQHLPPKFKNTAKKISTLDLPLTLSFDTSLSSCWVTNLILIKILTFFEALCIKIPALLLDLINKTQQDDSFQQRKLVLDILIGKFKVETFYTCNGKLK